MPDSVIASRRERLVVSAACALLAVVFIAWPQVDLWTSSLFRTAGGAWLLERNDPLLYFPYRIVPLLGRALLVGLLIVGLLACIPALRRRFPGLQRPGRYAAFVLAGALLGQGLLIDIVFKDHFGRARPHMVEAFGGSQQFTPAFIPADQCADNCSFVSGHVGNAAFIMALGWLAAPATRRRWLLASLIGAGLMGLARMAPGGHFLSDAIFAWFATYFSLLATEWLFRRQRWLA